MIIQHEDLQRLREKYQNKIIVYCSGTFDLPHLGHILIFNEWKRFGDILVVNVGCDYDISQKKPGRPILPETIRLRTVDEFKSVDFCFLGKRKMDDENSQARVVEIFESLKPDVYAVTDDASDMEYRRKITGEHGIELVSIPPVRPTGYPEFSTTWILEKIKSKA